MNTLTGGGIGLVAEGFVNVPIGKNAAIRVVAWDKKDAGYVDNKPATRTFPTWDADSGGNGTIDNVGTVAEDNYNDIFTRGARAALKFDLMRELDDHPDGDVRRRPTATAISPATIVWRLHRQQVLPGKRARRLDVRRR